MVAKQDDEKIARALASRLVAAFHPVRIVWFGSRAAGRGRPESDWDLLVVAESDLPQVTRMYHGQLATMDIEVGKDILVFTPAEHARLMTWKSSVVYDAERTGRVLYEAA